MLARLQQGIVAGLLVLVALWGVWSRDLPGWQVAAGFLLFGVGHALVLALEFLLMHFVNRTDTAPRAGAGALVRAWFSESVVAPRIFLWRQPFRSHAWPDRLHPAAPVAQGRRGVVFVHGFICNRGVWNPWLQRLERHGRVFAAVNLEPVFGSIDDYAAVIDAAVSRVAQATGLPPLLVCHSMGGLAVRAWLRAHQADDRVWQVVTIGTPHQGAWLARFIRVFNSHQMRIDSPWLVQVLRDETGTRAARFTCYYSNCDNIVFPASSAMLAGAANIHVPGVAHMAMLFEPRIMDAVLARLEDAPA